MIVRRMMMWRGVVCTVVGDDERRRRKSDVTPRSSSLPIVLHEVLDKLAPTPDGIGKVIALYVDLK